MIVYRISKRQYINDLSGFGAANFPGRWNSKGVYVLYTAATPSLALLESVVHMNKIVQAEYSMATIYLPDDSFALLKESILPDGWAAFPPPDKLKKFGDDFILNQEALAFKLPSSIMPEDFNFLINPAHPDFKNVKIQSVRKLTIDNRLL